MNAEAFKAYDIRGKIPNNLNEEFAFNLGRSIFHALHVQSAIIGMDSRLSSEMLGKYITRGLVSCAVKVSSLGLCGTEEIYYAAGKYNFDIGIMITGSHNPIDENGFKLVKKGAIPISSDSGLNTIKDIMIKTYASDFDNIKIHDVWAAGNLDSITTSFRDEHVNWLLSYTGFDKIKPKKNLKIVADVGNGAAGPILIKLSKKLPFDLTIINGEADGRFPNGIPNPLLPENREKTSKIVKIEKADLGIAWDGDFDRCFFYDHKGNFIEGYYLVGLLAHEMLKKFKNAKIIHDPRVYWNTQDLVYKANGIPIMGKTGHAFIKERMRLEDAVYGGEMSSHHYFKDFYYCDSGMLPWLFVIKILLENDISLSEFVYDRVKKYPCSGEINRKVKNAPQLIKSIQKYYAKKATYEDHLDGLNLEFKEWRFNIRMSNTEPLLRLNVESRQNKQLMQDKTKELLDFIDKNCEK